MQDPAGGRRGACWLLERLWEDNKITSTSENQHDQCRVNLSEVVFLDGNSRPRRWLYTGKGGAVSKRKEESLTWDKIKAGFHRAALGKAAASSNSQELASRNVCVVHTTEGQTYTLNKLSFDELLRSVSEGAGRLPGVAALQVFVSPRGRGKGAVFRNEYTVPSEPSGGAGLRSTSEPLTNTQRVLPPSRGGANESVASTSSATNALLDETTRKVVQFVQFHSRGRLRMSRLVLDYTVDDSETLWMTGVRECEVVEDAGERPTSRSKMRLLALKREREEGERQRSKEEGNDGRPGATSMAHSASMPVMDVRHAAADGQEGTSDKCWGEFCSEPAVEGAGRAVMKLSSPQDLKEAAMLPPVGSATPAEGWRGMLSKMAKRGWSGGGLADGSSKAKTIAFKSIVLGRAMKEAGFISTSPSGTDPDMSAAGPGNRLDDWRRMDERLQVEFGKKYPVHYYRECSVCSNCFAVYGAVDALRAASHRLNGNLSTPGRGAGRPSTEDSATQAVHSTRGPWTEDLSNSQRLTVSQDGGLSLSTSGTPPVHFPPRTPNNNDLEESPGRETAIDRIDKSESESEGSVAEPQKQKGGKQRKRGGGSGGRKRRGSRRHSQAEMDVSVSNARSTLLEAGGNARGEGGARTPPGLHGLDDLKRGLDTLKQDLAKEEGAIEARRRGGKAHHRLSEQTNVYGTAGEGTSNAAAGKKEGRRRRRPRPGAPPEGDIAFAKAGESALVASLTAQKAVADKEKRKGGMTDGELSFLNRYQEEAGGEAPMPPAPRVTEEPAGGTHWATAALDHAAVRPGDKTVSREVYEVAVQAAKRLKGEADQYRVRLLDEEAERARVWKELKETREDFREREVTWREERQTYHLAQEAAEEGAAAAKAEASKGGGVSANATQQATEKLSLLAKELQTTRGKLSTAQERSSSLSEKMRAMQATVAKQQREFVAVMREKDEAAKRMQLEMEEKHNRAMSQIQGAASASALSNGNTANSSSAAGESAGNKSLIQAVEALNTKFQRAQDEHSLEKQEIDTRHKLALLDEEEKGKRAVSDVRRETQRLEDSIADMQTEMCEMVKEVSIAKRREGEFERRLGEKDEAKAKLTQEISLLQQSLQMVGSMGGGAGGGGDLGGAGQDSAANGSEGMVSASQLQVIKTTSEARVRQLTNELDFLRAQLETDEGCKRDLEDALAATGAELKRGQAESRRLMADAEESRRKEWREMEERFRQELTGARHESGSLQDKVQSLQRQLTELIQDTAAARKSESYAKQSAEAVSAELRNAMEEVATLQRQASTLQQEAAVTHQGNVTEVTLRATKDAEIRKLRHEIDYIRSQLASEAQCKQELEGTLAGVGQQRREEAEQHKHELERVQQAQAAVEGAARSQETQLREDKIGLEGEVLSATKQLEDTKVSYARLRDQHRLDSENMESLVAVGKRREADLATAQEQIEEEKRRGAAAQVRNDQALAAIQQGMDQLERRRLTEVNKLDENMRGKLNALSDAQRGMLEMQDAIDHANMANRRAIGAQRLGDTMVAMLSTRRRRAFAQWRLNAEVARLEEERDAALREANENGDERAAQNLADALAKAKEAADEERERALHALRAEEMENAVRAVEMARAEHGELLSKAQSELEARTALQGDELAQLCERHAADLDATAKAAREAAAEGARRAEAARDQAVQATRTEEKATAERAMDAHKREHGSSLETKLRAMEDRCADAVTGAQVEAKKMAEDLQATFDTEKQELETELRGEMQTSIEGLLKEARTQREKAVAGAENRLKLAVEEASKEGDARADEAAEEARQAAARVAEEVKREAARRQEEALAKAAEAREAALAAARARAIEERECALAEKVAGHAAGVDQVRTELQAEQDRLLLEQKRKWQEAMKRCMEEAARDKAQELDNVGKAHEAAMEGAKQSNASEGREEQSKWAAEREGAIAAVKRKLEKEGTKKLKDLEARKQAALEMALERARQRMSQDVEMLRLDHNREMEAAHAQMQGTVVEAVQRSEQEKRAAAEASRTQSQAHAEAVIKEQREIRERTINEIRAETTQDHRLKMETQRKALIEKQAELVDEAYTTMDNRLAEMESNLKSEHASALKELNDAHGNEQVVAFRRAEELRAENQRISTELESNQESLEESEDQVYDARVQTDQLRRTGAVQRLHMVLSIAKAISHTARKVRERDDYWATNAGESSTVHRTELQKLNARVRGLQTAVYNHDTLRQEMHDTLVNHKREMLMEHKVQSTVLQNDLAVLVKQKTAVEDERDIALRDMKQLEDAVKEIERQMNDLGRVSAIQDGHVNVAHARKKRRLDQEFERMLEKAAEKRAELQNIDRRLGDVEDARLEKEDEMKDLERRLVELLVDQQKKLLSVIKKGKAVVVETGEENEGDRA